MKRWHVTALATVFVGGIAVAVALMFGHAATVTLVADGPIQVYDRASADPSQTSVIAGLKAGDEVAVTSCVDLKHYIVPEVVLVEGRTGYVIDGRFHLRREPPWSSAGKPTAWGC